ncbi:MAG TPA: flagellar basal body rod protein FlgB [Armatimonadota bacterium]|nr:flagellar basal body rod protein FlgB [Armatimonadota bacterium]
MDILSDSTGQALARSLDVAALRQRVIAHNIANIDTPGFKRSTVHFEDDLAEALNADLSVDERETRIGDLNPRVERVESSLRIDGNNVDIDLEAAELSENSLRYEALTRLVAERGRMMRSAINEGKR